MPNAGLLLLERPRPEIVSMQLEPGYDGKEIGLSGILYTDEAIETSGRSNPRSHWPAALRCKSPSHTSQARQRSRGLLDSRERGEDVAYVEIEEVAKAADMPRAAACRHRGTPRD